MVTADSMIQTAHEAVMKSKTESISLIAIQLISKRQKKRMVIGRLSYNHSVPFADGS